MNSIGLLGKVAVLTIVVGIAGVVVSLLTSNDLFTGSGEISTAAAVAIPLAFLGAVFVFMAVGRPWESWQRTPYW